MNCILRDAMSWKLGEKPLVVRTGCYNSRELSSDDFTGWVSDCDWVTRVIHGTQLWCDRMQKRGGGGGGLSALVLFSEMETEFGFLSGFCVFNQVYYD